MKVPRILICAGSSNSGKTLITCGILQALVNRGLKPASFKCGPDYIDPMFHTKVIGTRSRNLDTFFAGDETVRYVLAQNSRQADVAVIEGVMGYYDGIGGTTSRASAYDVARVTDTPSVLIVNCKGMSLSAAAFVQGYKNFREDSHIKGVILNRVSPKVYEKLKVCIEESCGVKVIGYVPQVDDCVIESRHLGLVMPDEIVLLREKLMKLASILEETLNLDLLLEMAGEAPLLDAQQPKLPKTDGEHVKIALARDEAFCFIYEDNIELLKKMGAEIVEFSPLHDSRLPEGVQGLILCGGYPELYANTLCGNRSMADDIASRCLKGLPVLAECGGFMYLHQTMEDIDGNPHKGVGLIEGRAYKTPRLGRFGYISLTEDKGDFFKDYEVEHGHGPGPMPAHEFHYFDSTDAGDCLIAQKPASEINWRCIHSTETMLAGFPHFYYYGNPALPDAFLAKCRKYGKNQLKG